MAALAELAARISGGLSDTEARIALLRLFSSDLLEVTRVAVERVAVALMERMILTGDEIRDIVNARSGEGVSND